MLYLYLLKSTTIISFLYVYSTSNYILCVLSEKILNSQNCNKKSERSIIQYVYYTNVTFPVIYAVEIYELRLLSDAL